MSVMHWPFCPAFISCCYQHVFYFVQINMDGWMEGGEKQLQKVAYWGVRQVFDEHMEMMLCDYLKNSARMYFGLTLCSKNLSTSLRQPVSSLASCATQLARELNDDWRRLVERFFEQTQEWYICTIATSIARASSFNEKNVMLFYSNLNSVRERYKFEANVDETGCTTVQKPPKVIVGALTSWERGQLVTVWCVVSAVGQAIPPLFVFPRVHFKDHFIRDAPAGSAGTAYPSGWMTSENFVTFLHHFILSSR